MNMLFCVPEDQTGYTSTVIFITDPLQALARAHNGTKTHSPVIG